ncbi:MAG: hypothetical protein IKE43_01655 [Coriobacteriales bacterium]|nr:hypothetical protein [Coriobacteriales bacterium]
MDFSDLTPEQIEKAKACKSVEELINLAKEEGLELSDEQLEAISGSEEWYEPCKKYTCYWFY